MQIGILALQGDSAEHRTIIKRLGHEAKDVRTIEDLSQCERLILPGGESTTISKLLVSTGLMEEIQRRNKEGSLPLFGTCAGAVLLAKTVTGKHVPNTLNLLDIEIERNAYGSQKESFETTLNFPCVTSSGDERQIKSSFIRAPKITHVGTDIEILIEHDGNPVLVRSGDILAGTFHTETVGETRVHEFFLAEIS